MTVSEMTYEFVKDLDTIDKSFQLSEKPDTETILLFLNIAQNRFIKMKYLGGRTIKENTQIITKNSDDLINLIKRTSLDITASVGSTDPYTNLAGYCNLAILTDYLHYIRSDISLTRTIPIAVSAQFVQGELIEYDEVDNYLTTPFNYPIIEFPKIIFQESNTMYVLHDMDTTLSTTAGLKLTYLRKPKSLVLAYTNTACYSNTTRTFSVGDKIYVSSGSVSYNSINYNSGNIFTILTGLTSVLFDNGTGCLLGLYATQALTCELAEYLHQDIVRLAVGIYTDELKFKLSPEKKQKQ